MSRASPSSISILASQIPAVSLSTSDASSNCETVLSRRVEEEEVALDVSHITVVDIDNCETVLSRRAEEEEFALDVVVDIDTGLPEPSSEVVNSSPRVPYPTSEQSTKPILGEKPKTRITYYSIVWWFYWITALLYVFDRLVTNMFPRQDFKIEKGFSLVTGDFSGYGTSKDMVDGFLADGGKGGDGPWLALVFDVLARVSGRLSVTATNLCFYTMMHTWHQFLHRIAPSWMDLHDVSMDMRRLHINGGIQIIVFTIPHIYSCFLLNIFNGFHLEFEPGEFDLPGTERHSYKTVDLEIKTVTLGVDDVLRLVEMTIILLLLLPWSYVLFYRRWDIGIKLHLVVGVMYFWDIVRRHSHPHSWIFNAPVFCCFVIDRMIGLRWKKHDVLANRSIPIGKDHLAIFVQTPQTNETSSLWFLHANGSSGRSHPFTTAQNRMGSLVPHAGYQMKDISSEFHAFALEKDDLDIVLSRSSGSLSSRKPKLKLLSSSSSLCLRPGGTGVQYNNLFVVGISHRKGSWTGKLQEMIRSEKAGKIEGLYGWGPFHSPYYRVHEELQNNSRPVMLVGSGSGAALVLDAVDYVCHHRCPCDVRVVYTARDPCLFQFVCDSIAEKIHGVQEDLNLSIRIHVCLTGKPGLVAGPDLADGTSIMQAQVGRFEFQSWVDESLKVSYLFFCGSPLLGNLLQKSCSLKNAEESCIHITMQGYHSFGGPTSKDIEDSLEQALADGLIKDKAELVEIRAGVFENNLRPRFSRKMTNTNLAGNMLTRSMSNVGNAFARSSSNLSLGMSNPVTYEALKRAYETLDF